MNINAIRDFFRWCTILNGGMLILYSLLIRFAGDWIFGLNNHWIPISRDAFDVAIYGLLGFYKILVIAFNLVPYIALVIIGRNKASTRVVENVHHD